MALDQPELREPGTSGTGLGPRWLQRGLALCGGGAAGAAALLWTLVAWEGRGAEPDQFNPMLEHIVVESVLLAVVLGAVAAIVLRAASSTEPRLARGAQFAAGVGTVAMALGTWQLARMPEIYSARVDWVAAGCMGGLLLLFAALRPVPPAPRRGRPGMLIGIRTVLLVLAVTGYIFMVRLSRGDGLVGVYVEDESAFEWLLLPTLALGGLLSLLAAARGRPWELLVLAGVLISPLAGYALMVLRWS